MQDKSHPSWLAPLLAGLATLMVFLPGIGWGLPTRADDQFLFGDRTPWTGQQIVDLAGEFDATDDRGADVDVNPLQNRAGVVLNATDADRAEIVRRYRLFSEQPDEFITLAAIAGMAQRRDADPRLYQYGGLWVYGVAALLGASKLVGLAVVTGDITHYLDHPEDFGRFYVIARVYSALWGAVGGAVVWVIVRRLSRCSLAATVAVATYALLPAVVTMAHEAKPHMAATVLMLLTCLLADNAVRRPTFRNAALAGSAAGAAAGMLISAVLVWLVVPLVIFMKPRDESANPRIDCGRIRGFADSSLGFHAALLLLPPVTYALTNPYVLINALVAPHLLTSNLGNSTAMYQPTSPIETAAHAAHLLVVGGGWVVVVGIVAAVTLPIAWRWGRRDAKSALPWLLAVPALAVLVQFVLLAVDDDGLKPAEYARFALFPIVCLALAAILLMHRLAELTRRKVGPFGSAWLALPVVLALIAGGSYAVDFLKNDERNIAARTLQTVGTGAPIRMRVAAEPAPYVMPPVNLWAYELVLVEEQPDLVVEDMSRAPMTWSNKRFRPNLDR